MKPVRIIAKNPEIDITVPMGNGSAHPTGGLGGWITVALQDDIEGVDWEGQEPLTEDVTLLLNGVERDEDIEREWNTIKRLGRDPNGDERKPPPFRLWGPVDHPGKWWVLPSNGIEILDAEDMRRNGSGELLRREFVFHLLEYTAPEVIKARRRKKRKKGGGQNSNGSITAPGNTYVTKKGDTLATIAAAIYGDWKRWDDIGEKNGIGDPNRKLPAGKKLRLP